MKKILMGLLTLVLSFGFVKGNASNRYNCLSELRSNESQDEIFLNALINFRNSIFDNYGTIESYKQQNEETLTNSIIPLFSASKTYLQSKGIYEELIIQLNNNENDKRIIQIALLTLKEHKDINTALNINNVGIAPDRDPDLQKIGDCIGHALGFGAIGTAGFTFATWISKQGIKEGLKMALKFTGTAVGVVGFILMVADFVDCMSSK